ncbi:MAG: HAMP domain-containing histidine kinase [Chloroflexi bacterium]|nr:HAMP domain-containing histidine kinase [Chloroflexota bacterium]
MATIGNGDNEYLSDLDKIKTAGNRLLALVDDILDLSRVESGKVDPLIEEVSVSGLVGEEVQVCRPSIDEHGNDLQVFCPDNIGSIKADENMLRQALCNLLSNSSKFTKNGSISLSVSRYYKIDGEWIDISVSDTGIGIEPEVIKNLFQPFSQANSSIIHTYGGTGLGLVITKRFCALMGGDVQVTSQLGEGSTFIISLPVQGTGIELPKQAEEGFTMDMSVSKS